MKNKKIVYFDSFEDDFFQVGEKYVLDEDYVYIQKKPFEKFVSAFVYGLAFVFSSIYCRLFLHVRFVGEEKLKREKGGFFMYGNHTQPVGDVFNPALACFPKRIYTVVSVANLHLPVIGKLLRPLGALPLPSSFSQMKEFNSAISERIRGGHPVIIYPEAHLWEYYTGIRPFDEAPFTYPAREGVPVYCFTTTYQKRKMGKKPRITVFVDGPFFSDADKRQQRARELRDAVFDKMNERARMSDYEYVEYVKR